MRTFGYHILLSIIIAWSQLMAAEPPAAPQTDVEKLVAQLGSEEFDLRESAHMALLNLDVDAAATLKRLSEQSTDPEVVSRLKKIALAIARPRWQRDLDAVKKAAKQNGKPILVFSTIGEPDGFS